MVKWIEREDGDEEKWSFQSEKDLNEVTQEQSLSSLAPDEQMIRIVAGKELQQKIVTVLQEKGLDNYVVYDEKASPVNIQSQSTSMVDALVFMVVVKAAIYEQLLESFNQHLDQKDLARFSCSEALFQIRLEE